MCRSKKGVLFLETNQTQEVAKTKSKFSSKQIAYASIFIALSVVVNSLRIGKVSFGGFPIIFSGYALGPVMGFVVGAMADIVGFIVRPSSTGGFNPLFIMTSALTGAIPVIVTSALGDKYPKYSLWKIFVGILVGQVVTSVIMVPIFLTILYGKKSLWLYMASAATKQAFSIPIYAALLKTLHEATAKVVNFREL